MKKTMKLLPILSVILWSGCASDASKTPEPMAADSDWITLFDGTDMSAFRGYAQEDLPGGWVIEDGAMYMSNPTQGGDIVTRDQFSDFDLELEWKLPEAGNSGIMFRVTEDHDYPWQTGPEYQLLDNDGHPDHTAGPKYMAGANYAVHPTHLGAAKPVGEWNKARIRVQGDHVEHWLNEIKVVEYDLGSDAWKAAVSASKWVDHPDYGMRSSGHIAIQGDHGPVWVRHIRIRRL